MRRAGFKVVKQALYREWRVLSLVAVSFVVLYYLFILIATMLRFGEIPNYLTVHDVLHNYYLILTGTPSLVDAIPILFDEPWLETGYKNPLYYGVATWSYMLIPLKMIPIIVIGLLLGVFAALSSYSKSLYCQLPAKRSFTLAGIGTGMVGLTSVTLTWVVCCATPSWVVALSMLGMSASLALWIEPAGKLLTFSGMLVMLWVVLQQARRLRDSAIQFNNTNENISPLIG